MNSTATDATKTWRYKAGITLFVGGHLVLLSGVVLPALGIGGESALKLAAGLVLGGELIAVTSIVFLGKDGFLAIKAKLTGAVKEGYVASVGPFRHYLGLCMFLFNVAIMYLIVYFTWVAYSAATQETPTMDVWGMGLDQQWDLLFAAFITGEVMFLVSLYVLGAEWWERFRKVIVFQPPGTT